MKVHNNIKVRRCGMIAKETTLLQRPNSAKVNNYTSPYSPKQCRIISVVTKIISKWCC